jgi:acetyltransferase-like isoleucine patch superfamily enzyme
MFISIGDGVWIGANVLISPGVNIGTHNWCKFGRSYKDVPGFSYCWSEFQLKLLDIKL